MEMSVNVRLHPKGCEDGMVKETFFSGERLAVLVEHIGDNEFAIIAGGIEDQEDLHSFFAMMEEMTRVE